MNNLLYCQKALSLQGYFVLAKSRFRFAICPSWLISNCRNSIDYPSEVISPSCCRGLQKSSSLRPCASIRLDEHVVTRLARFGKPNERLCMVAAAKSIHTMKLNDDGSLAGSSFHIQIFEFPNPLSEIDYSSPGHQWCLSQGQRQEQNQAIKRTLVMSLGLL